MSADAFPLQPCVSGTPDGRFSVGLAIDVAHVLEAHGYPAPASGSDWVELQQALFGFLYVERRKP